MAIEQLETKWEQHPVLHLDLNAKKYETAADLIAMLNQYLEKWEAIYGNEKKDRSPEERFSFVIEQASLKTGCCSHFVSSCSIAKPSNSSFFP